MLIAVLRGIYASLVTSHVKRGGSGDYRCLWLKSYDHKWEIYFIRDFMSNQGKVSHVEINQLPLIRQ